MDKRKFMATVLSLILLGISVMMGVNMVADHRAADDVQVEQSQEAMFY
ncbi:hypothetical protein BMS3Bbin04_00549 [bacterium BMS3Bbin04]|nr:hypothetical protein BMS3Bbin04_00549 [bacterium BMS3Bbin04]